MALPTDVSYQRTFNTRRERLAEPTVVLLLLYPDGRTGGRCRVIVILGSWRLLYDAMMISMLLLCLIITSWYVYMAPFFLNSQTDWHHRIKVAYYIRAPKDAKATRSRHVAKFFFFLHLSYFLIWSIWKRFASRSGKATDSARWSSSSIYVQLYKFRLCNDQ